MKSYLIGVRVKKMSKLTLEFDTVEDKEEMEMALKSKNYYAALCDFSEILRQHRKYGIIHLKERLDPDNQKDPAETAQNMNDYIEEEFYRVLNSNGVEL
jgi:hypothetical protein